jgi:hypothetical protein
MSTASKLREAGSSSQNQMQFEPRPERIPRKTRGRSSQTLTQILGAEIDRRTTNRASGKETVTGAQPSPLFKAPAVRKPKLRKVFNA